MPTTQAGQQRHDTTRHDTPEEVKNEPKKKKGHGKRIKQRESGRGVGGIRSTYLRYGPRWDGIRTQKIREKKTDKTGLMDG